MSTGTCHSVVASTFAAGCGCTVGAPLAGAMDPHEREPCPARIVDDLGGAFAFGAVCPSSLVRLLQASPSVLCRRWRLQQVIGAHIQVPCAPAALTAGTDSPISGVAENYVLTVVWARDKQVGGTFFHSIKGARNAPRGERLAGAVEAVKANARRLGGSFAVWGGLFSTFDCCLIAIRNKEDPYNSIVRRPP